MPLFTDLGNSWASVLVRSSSACCTSWSDARFANGSSSAFRDLSVMAGRKPSASPLLAAEAAWLSEAYRPQKEKRRSCTTCNPLTHMSSYGA